MKKLLFLLSVFLFISCDTSEKYQKIAGEWECTSWVVVATGQDKCNDNVFFDFKADKTYSSKLGNINETGVYQLAERKLFSTAEGKMEIAVDISISTQDTLQFEMSNLGQKEILTLLRKK
ncbi:lipocalin-like protein [Nonlabens xylanidelens]|uniref:Lipocalin-like protein n=1 Tax=Nonlabens xylanidelens TaxID=191564 RepID=A0A2S6IGT5_9FLAO|nr:lipocalin family protein [Nonlabens xylanidelens]PPK93370.1 lipocalin-like protein [Nonlabens xylanidelens]PQJ22682.1 hypothetical protein BST94_03715 [Nonlabens xylanidelens]